MQQLLVSARQAVWLQTTEALQNNIKKEDIYQMPSSIDYTRESYYQFRIFLKSYAAGSATYFLASS